MDMGMGRGLVDIVWLYSCMPAIKFISGVHQDGVHQHILSLQGTHW